MNGEEVDFALARASSRAERLLWLAAMLRTETGGPVVIVGGSAIEVYTSDAYVSGDLDLVGDRPRLIEALERWGFKKSGRLWAKSALEAWVDPVGPTYNGDEARLKDVLTPFGPVQLASVEDLIGKRLIEAKVWPGSSVWAFDQAMMLAAEFEEELDWDYTALVASREGASDLVPELRRRLQRRVGASSRPRRARRGSHSRDDELG
jgi:hypothetical protein